jgi:RND family efflux transporter MFP subunit
MATSAEIIEATQIEAAESAPKPGQRRRASGMVRLIGLSSIAMALVLPIGVYPRLIQGQTLDRAETKIVQQVPTVSVVQPEAAGPERQINLPGSVEALQAAPIYARANGYVKARYADIGDRVQAGQLLADIETPEVDESAKEARAQVMTQLASKAQTQANLDKARADLDTTVAQLAQARAGLIERQSNQHFALISHERWLTLAEQGAVSYHDSDEKINNYKISKAATQAAEDNIRSLQSQVVAARARVNAELANINMSDANIDAAQARQHRTETEQHFNRVTAPFAGVITERNIDPGQLITSGSENTKQVLYRIARIDTVKVFVEVPQYTSSGIREGQSVTVSLKEFPKRTFVGHVLRTSVALDANARTLKTEIHIPNKDLTLTPGMYADVSFSIPRSSKTFLIPTNALIAGAEGTQVAVAGRDGIISYRKVQVGDDLGKQLEIVAGLNGNENIVVNPSDTLKSGTKIALAQNK